VVQVLLDESRRLLPLALVAEREHVPRQSHDLLVPLLEAPHESEVVTIDGRRLPLPELGPAQRIELPELVLGRRVLTAGVVTDLADLPVRRGLELVKDPRPQEAQLEPPEPRPLLADIPESLGSYDGQR